MLNAHALRTAFSALNLEDRPVIAHGGFRRFGPVEGGGETVIQALLENTRGVMMPTFTYKTMVTPQVGPPDNGLRYDSGGDHNKRVEAFQPDMIPDKMIGILPWVLIQQPGAKRTTHPILSFGGVGVDKGLARQTLADPLAPISWLAEQKGSVVLINVDQTVNTSIHYAEKLLGRRQFLRWALLPDRIVECPGYPSDSTGFQGLEPYIREDLRRIEVRGAFIQTIPLDRLFAAVETALRRDPLALLCQRLDCGRCNAVRRDRTFTVRTPSPFLKERVRPS